MERPASRILPEVTPDSAAFWAGGAEGELRIHRCRACSRFFHPPAPACFRCRSRDVGPEAVSGRATLASYTVNHHPWFGAAFPVPYVIGLVELAEEPDTRLTTQIVDCDPADVRFGMAVEVEFERHEDVWVPVFRPAKQGSAA
jgi:uncharacterized protein